ncbi:AMP-binding protein [Frigidibacter sp. ROC022]|uniref:AMP-binding protein n=1 Tax=Frigidibacter sp. ROC022 TaxID=2971796 RepID=UPI00215B2893|nr:AMP-binding protein [Frigidibacter sp. ROC022]MCR8725544.1 AMP-binding protein [Frigidibacter sp. ROC022]
MTLISRFAQRATGNPQKIALLTEKSQMSFEDILHLVHLLDVELTTRGVRPGQTIVMTSRRPEFCIALCLLLSLRQLTVIFSTPGPVLAAGLDFDRMLSTEPIALLEPERQIVIEQSWFASLGTLPLPDYTAEPGGGAFVFRSSGTTGTPKFICSPETERARIGDANAFCGKVDLSTRRLLSTLTCHSGLSVSLQLETLLAGGSVVALAEGSANALPWIDLYHVDTLGTSPAVLQAMLRLPRVGQYLGSVRDIRIGGAQAGRQLLESFSQVCPARVHLGYGSAEVGPCFRWIYEAPMTFSPSYIGEFLRTDLEVGFFDEELNPLPDATEGIVGFRPVTGSLPNRYLGKTSDEGTGFIDGWFFPGDILRREGDQYFVVGRTKEIVNFGGNKFSLAAVRQALAEAFPGAALEPVVLTDEGGLERLGVAYVSEQAISETDLTAALKRFLGLKVIRTLKLAELPLTETGKVDAGALRQMFQQG